MAIARNVTNESSVTLSVTPSSGLTNYQGGDCNIRLYNNESSAEYGNICLFIQISSSYSTSTRQYVTKFHPRIYSKNKTTSSNFLWFRITSVTGFQNVSYQQWTSMTSLPTSSVPLASEKTAAVGEKNFSASFTIQFSNSSSGTSAVTYNGTTPSITLNFGKNNFTCYFESNGSGWTTKTQNVYYGETPSDPGTPNQPSDSLNRTINVAFNPTGGNESSITSSVSVMDSWNTPSWGLGPIYGSKTFYYNYSRVYTTSPVMIPSWSTSNGKPTKNGYLFNYWDYNGENIGSEPGSQTNYSFGGGGGTSYSTSARWKETSSDYTIYPKYKIGDEIKDITFTDDSGSSDINVVFTLSWESNKSVSSIPFKSFLKNGLRVDSSKVYNLKNNSEVTSISGKSQDKEYYVLYNIIQDQVTLNLNGGNINGNTNNIVIPYNRFSGGISIKSDYKPVKDNTTFVAWLDIATNVYVDEIDPSAQDVWPSNKILSAEYIPIGFFMCRKDRIGKLYWEAIINKWVFHNGQWRGEYVIPGTEIVHTSTSAWVLRDGQWKLEYGKQDLPLS